MNEPAAYIIDSGSLKELCNALTFSADNILKLAEAVRGYLEGVLEALQRQKEALEKALEEAEKELEKAEAALRSCEESQEWDEEEHEYRPSCSTEAASARSARERRDDIQRRLTEAETVIRDCGREYDTYMKTPGITSGGGDSLLKWMAKEHTKEATDKIKEILAIVDEYRRCRVSLNGSSSSYDTDSDQTDTPLQLTNEQKAQRFKDATARVIQRQDNENWGSRKIADANRLMYCRQCGRPLVACICNHQREREYALDQIEILKNDRSR